LEALCHGHCKTLKPTCLPANSHIILLIFFSLPAPPAKESSELKLVKNTIANALNGFPWLCSKMKQSSQKHGSSTAANQKRLASQNPGALKIMHWSAFITNAWHT